MKLETEDLRALADIAVEAAVEAGQMIAGSRPQAIEHKSAGDSPASQVVTEVDRRSEEMILARLAPTLARYELALLTEEREDDGSRLRADHFWCIDPLDGTLPFVEGRSGYSVSIALVARDGTPQIGVVYDPVAASIRHAVRGGGAVHDGQPLLMDATTAGAELSVYVDRSFLAMDDVDVAVEELERIAADLGMGGVRFQAESGAVMNACSVLADPPACYLKHPKTGGGGGSLWDFAATACLFAEVGAVATDIEGQPLDLNREDATSMGHRGVLFATDEDLAARLRHT